MRGFLHALFQKLHDQRHSCCRAQLQDLQEELADVRSQLADATQKVADMQIELSKEKAAMHHVGEQQQESEDTGMEGCRCRLHIFYLTSAMRAF